MHVSTPSIFSGYVLGGIKHKSLYKGWLNTGDIGYVDANESLYIVERVDDVIILDSHKIYPSEIESQILESTSILECAVVKVENNDCRCEETNIIEDSVFADALCMGLSEGGVCQTKPK